VMGPVLDRVDRLAGKVLGPVLAGVDRLDRLAGKVVGTAMSRNEPRWSR